MRPLKSGKKGAFQTFDVEGQSDSKLSHVTSSKWVIIHLLYPISQEIESYQSGWMPASGR